MTVLHDFFMTIPDIFFKFIMVTFFALLIGLEQRSKYLTTSSIHFGTDRTFTLIGILGFILYVLEPVTLLPFLLGALLLGTFLISFYNKKMESENKYGITGFLAALITYCLAPLLYTQPNWFVILLVVTVLILEEMKRPLIAFTKKIESQEFITLAKFLLMIGVILPLLPSESLLKNFDFSLYKFWLAIVAISGISYGSYLLKKYVFPSAGIILTGILGGMYSSTATTIILAKKSKEIHQPFQISSSILLATAMMFIRIFILALVFNAKIAREIAPAFAVLFVATVIISAFYLKRGKGEDDTHSTSLTNTAEFGNPLELKTAFVFGGLFIFFAIVTHFITKEFGAQGIQILSYLVGVTDIDPFILNVFQSKFSVPNSVLVSAILNATTSNNVLKLLYAISLSDKAVHSKIFIGFSILIVLGIISSFIY